VLFEREVASLSKLKEKKEIIGNIDSVAREFLRETYHISKNTDYADIGLLFAQKNKPAIATFCNKMQETLFSGEEIDSKKIESLLLALRTIVHEEAQKSVKKEERLFVKLPKIAKTAKSFNFIKNLVNPEKEAEKSVKKEQEIKIPLIKEVPKSKIEASVIKQPVIKQQISQPRPKQITVFEFNKEKKEEPKHHKYIESLDKLDRIENKLRNLKKDVITRRFY